MNYLNLKNYIQIILACLIGAVCLYLIAGRFDWQQIWTTAKQVNYALFFAVESLTLFACFFLRTLRWRVLLNDENLTIPFGKLYLYNSIAIGISTITPFQSGEALKVELLKNYGGQRLSGYAVFFLERIFDLLTVLGLAVISTAFGLDFGVNPFYLYLVTAILVTGVAAAITAIFRLRFEIFQPLKVWLNETRRRKKSLALAFLLTILAWTAIIFGWKFALAFFGVSIGFLPSTALVSLTTLVAIISFVPGAVGVSELSIVAILSAMRIEPAAAQVGAIGIRAYALVILVLTLLHWLYLKFFYKNQPNEVK